MAKVLLKYNKIDETKSEVVGVYADYGSLPSEFVKSGIFVEAAVIPQSEFPDKQEILFISPSTNELWLEYKERVLQGQALLENELNTIKQQQGLMQQAIDDLIFGGAL